jgi:hypothetical protein
MLTYACLLKAAIRRTSKATVYAQQVLKMIEKEREGMRLKREEEERQRLADQERQRAAIQAQVLPSASVCSRMLTYAHQERQRAAIQAQVLPLRLRMLTWAHV